MNKYDLDGKVVVITGGVIGRAIATLLLKSNATVSLWDVSGEALEAALRALGARHCCPRRMQRHEPSSIDERPLESDRSRNPHPARDRLVSLYRCC